MTSLNPVFEVLATSGNQAVLAINKKVEDLAPGQIGVFNAHTNLSVSTASPVEDFRDFYIAVGRNGNIKVSAGFETQRRNVSGYTLKVATNSKPKIVDITNFSGMCDTDYMLKVEVRSQSNYISNGYNGAFKTYAIHTGCCPPADCVNCPAVTANEVALKMVKAINKDSDGVIKAELLDYTTTPGTPVVVDMEDFDTWVTGHANKYLGIRITSIESTATPFNTINPSYFNSRYNDIIVSFVAGFECNGEITKAQDLVMEEGSGYDLAQLEYFAAGWNEVGPYRTSPLARMPLNAFDSMVSQTGKYSQVVLDYAQASVSGWSEYKNSQRTIIAVPDGDNTTLTGLITLIDKALSGVNGLGPLSDDLTALTAAGGVTSEVDNPDADGIA